MKEDERTEACFRENDRKTDVSLEKKKNHRGTMVSSLFKYSKATITWKKDKAFFLCV